ncbi:MAG: sigma-54 dependent transcriptional regulator [Candidatus Methylomirabilis sp.]|nr:sigma-54 dependent transcriptional regulator [Deltaproteobacteria bacterium]
MAEQKSRKVLVIDDEPSLRSLFERYLRQRGYEVQIAETGEEGLERYDDTTDVVLLDLGLPGMSGMEVVRALRGRDPQAHIILMTGYGTVETALQAMDWGVTDYLQKPLKLEHVDLLIQRQIEVRRLREENVRLREELQGRFSETGLVGDATPMREVVDMIRRVAPTDATALIYGESGVGKELAARALHSLSRRKDGPFLSINCSALSETLLESELFGYEKGAFTGAESKREGLLAACDGGTLFLDEIGDMPPALQAKMLRAVQEGEFIPVGGRRAQRVDIRFVAATHKNLAEEVKGGRFRQDLYFRLNIVSLEMPPLRKRRSDIPLLANLFLERYVKRMQKDVDGFAAEAMDLLIRYDWPGNVRELENVIERGVAMDADRRFGPDDLPNEVLRAGAGRVALSQSQGWDASLFRLPLGEFTDYCEKRYLEQLLGRLDGSIKQASKDAGVNEKTLYLKMRRHGLRKEDYKE